MELTPAVERAPNPRTLALFLSLKCNYRCFFCARRENSSYADLPLERLAPLEEAIRDADTVDITGWGEPFMYPRIAEAIALITRWNPRDCITVTTNGSHLRDRYAELLGRNLRHIVYSLNAATQATYERDMVHGRWRHVLGRIERARRWIPGGKTILSFVGHRDNIDEFPAFVRLAATLGAGGVTLTPLIVTDPRAIDRSLWFHKRRSNEAVQEARCEGAKLGVRVVASTFDGAAWATPRPPCTAPSTEAFVLVDGDVGPCCYAGARRMGNIDGPGGFSAVWNGEPYQALRRARHFPECQACLAHGDLDDLATHMGKGVAGVYDHAESFAVVVPVDHDTTAEGLETATRSLAWQTYPVHRTLFALACPAPELTADVRAHIERGERGGAACVVEAASAVEAVARAVAQVRGEYVALLRPGTAWRPDKLELLLRTFGARSPAPGAVLSRTWSPGRGLGATVALRTTADGAAPSGLARVLLGAGAGPDAVDLAEWTDFAVPSLKARTRRAWLEAAAGAVIAHGEAALLEQRREEAGQAFLAAVQLCPSSADAWSDLATSEWLAGRQANAVQAIQSAVALDPSNATLVANSRSILAGGPPA